MSGTFKLKATVPLDQQRSKVDAAIFLVLIRVSPRRTGLLHLTLLAGLGPGLLVDGQRGLALQPRGVPLAVAHSGPFQDSEKSAEHCQPYYDDCKEEKANLESSRDE